MGLSRDAARRTGHSARPRRAPCRPSESGRVQGGGADCRAPTLPHRRFDLQGAAPEVRARFLAHEPGEGVADPWRFSVPFAIAGTVRGRAGSSRGDHGCPSGCASGRGCARFLAACQRAGGRLHRWEPPALRARDRRPRHCRRGTAEPGPACGRSHTQHHHFGLGDREPGTRGDDAAGEGRRAAVGDVAGGRGRRPPDRADVPASAGWQGDPRQRPGRAPPARADDVGAGREGTRLHRPDDHGTRTCWARPSRPQRQAHTAR